MRVLLAFLALLLAPVVAAPPALAAKADLIVVEKAKRKMTLFAGRKALKTYRIVLGGNPVGHKEQEGDSRTPEGRYTIDAKNPNSSFYKSLHISYPDRRDRARARSKGVSPGGAIMIHGTPESLALLYLTGTYPDWTAGCIAATNAEMDEIFKLVPLRTPILIKP
jgi:murein L,D-transpeptidase YafK